MIITDIYYSASCFYIMGNNRKTLTKSKVYKGKEQWSKTKEAHWKNSLKK